MFSAPSKLQNLIYLLALDADDAVEVPRHVIVKVDIDGGIAGGDPGPLRLRVNVKDVRLGAENGRLAELKELKERS